MSIWIRFVPLLQRRLIIGLLFVVSLTFCVLTLLRQEKKGMTFGNDFDDIENLVISDSGDDILNVDGEEVSYKSQNKPLLWQLEVLNDGGNSNLVDSIKSNTGNENELSKRTCRNSVQGKVLIVDEKGYICARYEILTNGCCPVQLQPNLAVDTSEKVILQRDRFSCDTCNSNGCCAVYEYCVSCCLHPSKYNNKRTDFAEEVRKGNKKSIDILKLRLRSLDQFQVCLAACRTSSTSVRHENTYKNPHIKHCYNIQPPSELHESPQHRRRNLVSIKNKYGSYGRIPSSSAVMLFHKLPFIIA